MNKNRASSEPADRPAGQRLEERMSTTTDSDWFPHGLRPAATYTGAFQNPFQTCDKTQRRVLGREGWCVIRKAAESAGGPWVFPSLRPMLRVTRHLLRPRCWFPDVASSPASVGSEKNKQCCDTEQIDYILNVHASSHFVQITNEVIWRKSMAAVTHPSGRCASCLIDRNIDVIDRNHSKLTGLLF